MPLSRDKLLWMALVTLAEQVQQAEHGPRPPSHGVRLALAVAFTFSKGDRTPFEDFWRQMQDDCANTGTPTTARYCRTTFLQTQLRGVMHAVGIEPTVATEEPLAEAARKAISRRRPGDGHRS